MASDFDAVLASLYEAAVVRDTWPKALQKFADLYDSRGALITRGDRNHEGLLYSASLAPTVAQFFEQNWHLNDYRTTKCVPKAGQGFVTDRHIIAYDDIAESEYYSGFARPAGVPWFTTGGMVRSDGVAIGFSLQRSDGEGPFSNKEVGRLNMMLPRLCEVLSLAYRINSDRGRSMLLGLELVDQAALLIDGQGRVRDMNAAARALIGLLFTMRAQRPLAVCRGMQDGFARWVDAALASAPSAAMTARRIIRLEDIEGRSWIGQAMPVAGEAGDIFSNGHAILMFIPAHAAGHPSAAVLAIAFGLTPAEARVAERVAAGLTVDQVAASLSLNRNAVRFHMKSILPKANVRRHAAFVAAAAALSSAQMRNQ